NPQRASHVSGGSIPIEPPLRTPTHSASRVGRGAVSTAKQLHIVAWGQVVSATATPGAKFHPSPRPSITRRVPNQHNRGRNEFAQIVIPSEVLPTRNLGSLSSKLQARLALPRLFPFLS